MVSYCVSDLTADIDRASLGWINHLSLMDLAVLFDRFGFRVERSDRIDEMQFLMRLTPDDRAIVPPACDVAVISYNDVGNFGDRLGYHIVNSLLPATADVHHLTFRNLQAARETYDLVILGIGNSMFQPLLTDEIFDVLNRGKASIGIFGTQYRELIPRPSMDALLDRLDTWYARYEEDVLMYGRGRSNVVHLGDWLIDQFPMSTADRGFAADHRRGNPQGACRSTAPSRPSSATRTCFPRGCIRCSARSPRRSWSPIPSSRTRRCRAWCPASSAAC